MYYPPYYQYVRNYLYNETYALGNPVTKNDYSSKFTVDLLNIIDQKIDSKKSKNALLKQTVISHFYNKSSCDINKDAFDRYFELSTSKKDKDLIQQIINDSKAVVKNKQIQDFKVTDYSNAIKSIKEIIKNKNVVLFFWSPENYSDAYIASRTKFLSNRYLNIKFIQIKMNGIKTNRIKELDIKNQFYIDKNSAANTFLTSKMPRCILINKKGVVTNGFASFSSYNIETYLKELNEK